MVLTSVCSLLVCATLGLVAEADPIRTTFLENVDANLIDDGSYEAHESEEDPDMNRLAQEIEAFPSGLMVYNDDGSPVEVSLAAGAGGDESEDESRTSLADRVKFHLYTRKNPAAYQELLINDEKSLASSFYSAKRPTRFVTHGWVNSGNSPACTLIRDAYLKHDDLNVIVVDWNEFTLRPYLWASSRVLMVGQHVAKMIDFLETHGNLDTNKTTLVGHSLGAHVVGLAGYYAKGTINYIVGLDPALPMFMFSGPGSRISSQDANHVQIIHTNAGLLGYRAAIGHSDFYPNGGTSQLGCFPDIGGACSHARSYEFFAESINSITGFYGKPCTSFLQLLIGRCNTKSIAVMGGPLVGFVPPGKYFLTTKRKSLYARGI